MGRGLLTICSQFDEKLARNWPIGQAVATFENKSGQQKTLQNKGFLSNWPDGQVFFLIRVRKKI
jgi:hypothetical protein